jgi:hypothetical protein
MTASDDYGICDTCMTPLTDRYWSFDRQVEQFVYDQPGHTPAECASVTVLRSEPLGFYCGRGCAFPAALLLLAERGLRSTECGAGPIETCAKCGGPVDLTKPHVLYQLMDQTETRKPWLISIQPLELESLAYVCPRCDGDLTANEMNLPEAETEIQPLEAVAITPAWQAGEPVNKEICHD